jgi:hypothetical protein
MKLSRKNNGFNVTEHMKQMSKSGNEKLKELHKNPEWLEHKSEQISKKVTDRGGHNGHNNPMFNKTHNQQTRSEQSSKAQLRNPSVYERATLTKIANGIAIPKELKTKWELYKEKVDNITRSNWIQYENLINPENYPRGQLFNLDHKVSKRDGFINDVPPEVIGHYKNLEILTEFANKSKGSNSSITIDELYTQVKL